MRTQLHSLLVGASCALLPVSAFAQMEFSSGVALPNSGGEILSFYAPLNLVASTYSSGASHGVRFTQLNADRSLGAPATATVDLSGAFSASSLSVFSVSSVQVDNQGRDFGVATLIPGNNTDLARVDNVGKAVFFRISDGALLGSVDVGYHPDSVTITPNGSRLVVANEAEYVTSAATVGSVAITQRAGSVSVIDLSGVTSASDLQTKLGNSQIGVSSVGFEGVDLSNIRINATNPGTITTSAARALYVEPEYVVAGNDKAYVSLQENNAIATINLSTNTVESVRSLGTLTQTIDNTDRKTGQAGLNRAEINVNATATGLLMPDTIARFEKGGETYLVTANEGDARNDAIQSATDEVRVGRLNTVATGFEGAGNMFGTRSISIVRASDGSIVWDSSDGQGTSAAFKSFEDYIAAFDPTTFNMNQNNAFAFQSTGVNNFTGGLYTNATGTEANSDTRSDDKGPEPESVAYASINGRDFVFAAMERQGGIFMFDVTDFNNISLVNYINLVVQGPSTAQSYLSPESLQFVSAADNITGRNLLLVGYENPSNPAGGLAVITVIPEPSAAAGLAGFGALGLAVLRRRRRGA